MSFSSVLLTLFLASSTQNHFFIRPNVVALNDVNGNGSPDIAVSFYDPFKRITIIKVKDGLTGANILFEFSGDPGRIRVQGESVRSLRKISDINGNGTDEIVAWLVDSPFIWARTFDSLTGAEIASAQFDFSFSDVLIDMDVMSNWRPNAPTPGLIRVYRRRANRFVTVTANYADATEEETYYSPDVEAKFVAIVPDVSGNGLDEAAVVGRDVSGKIRAQIKDIATGAHLNMLWYAADYDLRSTIVIPDIDGASAPAVGVHGVHADGRIRLQIKDVVLGTPAGAGLIHFDDTFDFEPEHRFRTMKVIPDFSGNDISEVGYLGADAAENFRMQIKDAGTGALLSQIFFARDTFPTGIAVVGDINGNGVAEIAVVGVDPNTGTIRVQIKDALTGEQVNRIFIQ